MLSFLKECLQLACGRSAEPAGKYVGPLHKLMTDGDYNLSGFAPLIEGGFIEVNENLQIVDQSEKIKVTTIALVVIKAGCAIPVMIFAKKDESSEEELKITRLYPLQRLKFSMDETTCTLRVEVINKGVFYYKLLVPVEADPQYISRWLMIISLLDDS
ncbi:Golgi-associated RAB2 interactor protein 6-like [Rhinoderma darwinii]|uniref:Golgi-associated RAB2 interactor protein 6-like n=1 Tax=Rhinoderma darwinii TaxID=43563 RepID=UPI003F66C776